MIRNNEDGEGKKVLLTHTLSKASYKSTGDVKISNEANGW